MAKPLIKLAPLAGLRAQNRASGLGKGSVRVNATSDDAADVYLYGDIGGWWDGVTADDLVKEIAALDVKTLHVHVNSPGGLVFDGVAIYNAFAAHPAHVIMYVEGIAASIASVILCAGDEIHIGASSNIMIHKPWSFSMGDAEALRKEAEILDILEEGIIDIYAARTGKTVADLQKLLAAETWLRGQLAIDEGFADEIIPSKAKEKKVAQSALLQLYAHTPNDLIDVGAPVAPHVRQFEHHLRDAEQMPNALAKRVATAAQRLFQPARDELVADPRDEGGKATETSLQRLAAHIRSIT